ncbi:MAG: hypothetical protein M0Q21_06650 [Ignavibacteriaceae bacterium]|nr:hypothetical protein [Ignavibacteriaceae bacterium]
MATTTIISHTVANFVQWKVAFDAGEAIRAQSGITINGVYQNVGNENEVTIIAEVSDIEVTKALFASPEFKASMENGGVTSIPEVKILKLAF